MITDTTQRATLAGVIDEAARPYFELSGVPEATINSALAGISARVRQQLPPDWCGHEAELAKLMLDIHVEGLREEVARLTRERDLAVAHDRQPYPTAWAYEQACKTIDRLRAALRQIAVSPKEHELVASICEIALAPSVGVSSR